MSNLRADQFSIAHPTYQVGRDPFGLGDRFEHCHIAGEVGFMPATKRPQKGAQRCLPAFTRVAMHLASPIAIIVACPFTGAMIAGAVNQMHTSR